MSFEERKEYVLKSIESHDRQIGELFDGLAQQKVNIDAHTRNVKALVEVSNRDAVDILKLANTADNHGKRFDRIEGGQE